MLSLIASVFDPLGLVAPAVLKGKTVFQKATQLGVGWDDRLLTELLEEFDQWHQRLFELEKLRPKRWVATPETTD